MKKQTRRDFIKSLGRNTTIAVLALGSGWLLLRNPNKDTGTGTCQPDNPCRNCRTFSKCTLPKARLEKQRAGQNPNSHQKEQNP